jgi:hypothetical protein
MEMAVGANGSKTGENRKRNRIIGGLRKMLRKPSEKELFGLARLGFLLRNQALFRCEDDF